MLCNLEEAGCNREEINDFRVELANAAKPDVSNLCMPCHKVDRVDDALVALGVPVLKPTNLLEQGQATGLEDVLDKILSFKHLALEEEAAILTSTLNKLGVALQDMHELVDSPDMAAAFGA